MKAINQIRSRLMKAAGLIGNEVARIAAEKWVPKGWSLDLSRSTVADKPIQKQGEIWVVVKSGTPYARRQHNDALRHFSPQGSPLLLGYTDAASRGGTQQARYRSGYSRLKEGSDIYAARWFPKAIKEARPFVKKIIQEALRG